MTQSNPQRTKGPACTVTIAPGEAGVLVSVDFGEGALDFNDPTLTQSLALVAADAVRQRIDDLRRIGELTGSPVHPTRHLN